VDAIPHDIDQKARVVVNVVVCLNNKLLESSHEILDCFFALFKGKQTLLSVASDVWGLERLFKLVRELVEGVHSVKPLGDVKIHPLSCSVLSFHIGQNYQHLLPVRGFLFKPGEVEFHSVPPLNIFGPVTIIWFGFGGNRFADSDVRLNQRVRGEEPWGLGLRGKVDPRGPWHMSCSRNG